LGETFILKPVKADTLSNYIIPSIIALGVTIPLFVETALLSTVDADIEGAFNSFSGGLLQYYDFRVAWRPRIFSNALAASVGRFSEWILGKTSIPFVQSPLELTVAGWTVFWFLLICAFLILFAKRRSLFYIFGFFAGLSFGYMPRLATRIYPWDMPALFIFLAFILLFAREKKWWLFALLPLGMGFKETSIILCVAFLFLDLPWNQKWMMAIGATILCIAVKIALDIYVREPIPFFTMQHGLNYSRAANVYVIRNLIGLITIIPFFINSGTLLALFLLPIYEQKILGLKLIGGLFLLGNMFFGNIYEYRIWFEMLPFALYGLEIASYGTSGLIPLELAEPNPHA